MQQSTACLAGCLLLSSTFSESPRGAHAREKLADYPDLRYPAARCRMNGDDTLRGTADGGTDKAFALGEDVARPSAARMGVWLGRNHDGGHCVPVRVALALLNFVGSLALRVSRFGRIKRDHTCDVRDRRTLEGGAAIASAACSPIGDEDIGRHHELVESNPSARGSEGQGRSQTEPGIFTHELGQGHPCFHPKQDKEVAPMGMFTIDAQAYETVKFRSTGRDTVLVEVECLEPVLVAIVSSRGLADFEDPKMRSYTSTYSKKRKEHSEEILLERGEWYLLIVNETDEEQVVWHRVTT